MRAYDQLRRRLTDVNNDDNAKLEADGIALAELLLDETVRTVLPRQRESHLVVVHDAQMSRAPWETMGIAAANGGGKAWFPAAEQGLSHRYAAENLSVAKWLEERLQDDILHVLLVANPTADLEGAELEAKRVQELFKRVAGCRLDVLHQKAASRPALLAAFSSGKYDVVHYAGHAFFDEANPERSGLYCAGNAVLTGADVAGLAKLPTLVFFNACEAARVRGRAAGRAGAAAKTAKAAKVTKTAAQDRIEKSVGVAEALMRGGVANFLGTYWPVGDAAATEFADAFYRGLLGGQPISQAVQAGRGAVKKTGSKDWADYVFYGNPDFVLKEATGAST
jgi:CHAT domain-containing protein